MHDRTESHFVFLAQKTENTFDLIIYDATLYFRIAGALGWDLVGATFSQGGFVVDGFALLRNCEVLTEDLNALNRQKAECPSDAYLVSSLRLLVDGFLGDEEVFRSFGHTFLHEQQYISFDHWKKFQASRAVKDIMLLDHGFHEAERDRASTLRSHDEEFIGEAEHDHESTLGPKVEPALQYQERFVPWQEEDCLTERTAPIPEISTTLGNSGEDYPTASLAEYLSTPLGGATITPEQVEVMSFIRTLYKVEDQDPAGPCLSPKELLEQLPGPATADLSTSVPWQPDIQSTSDWQSRFSYVEFQGDYSTDYDLDGFQDFQKSFEAELHHALRLQKAHLVREALLRHQGCDRIFPVLLSSIQEAAELGRGDILTLLLDSDHFDPRVNINTTAARMEMCLQVTMRYNLQETGEILVEYYLRHELYNWGNIDWVAYEAARHGCHWVLSSIMSKANLDAMDLAYQAAKHAPVGTIQATLIVLSSFEPELLRISIDNAAKAADTRSVRALLSAAQESKDLRHAGIVWEAARTGDAQTLFSIFGPDARNTVLTLLQEAGNMRVRQVHDIFTRRYPRLLMHLRKASCRFPINIEGFTYKWQDWESNSALLAWDRGIRALKHLVQGNVPDNVPDVMLVLSIAEALSATLESTYTPSKSWSDEFLGDLPRWQTILPKSLHAAYAYCAGGLWGMKLNKSIPPEPLSDSDLLDRFQGLAICLLHETTDVLGLNENASGNSLHSSQQRRACLGQAETESQNSPLHPFPYHEASARWLEPWDDRMDHEIDMEPNEVCPRRPRTWQAITERLQYSIPSSKVPSIFIMMGAIFFCLLQFTFCKFLAMACPEQYSDTFPSLASLSDHPSGSDTQFFFSLHSAILLQSIF